MKGILSGWGGVWSLFSKTSELNAILGYTIKEPGTFVLEGG
jgi:hypothetical protein